MQRVAWVGVLEGERQRRARATLCTNYLKAYLDSNVPRVPFFSPFRPSRFSWEGTCIAADSPSPSIPRARKRKYISPLCRPLGFFLDLAGRMRKLFAEDMGRPPRNGKAARLGSFSLGASPPMAKACTFMKTVYVVQTMSSVSLLYPTVQPAGGHRSSALSRPPLYR